VEQDWEQLSLSPWLRLPSLACLQQAGALLAIKMSFGGGFSFGEQGCKSPGLAYLPVN
jgi:hypothetical protein